MTVRTRIIRIGNSHGIRIPKPLLEQSGIEDEVELEVDEKKIVIHAVEKRRHGWDNAFSEMAVHEDDVLFDSAQLRSEWDEEEWEW